MVMVIRRVSEGESATDFVLAFASGFLQCRLHAKQIQVPQFSQLPLLGKFILCRNPKREREIVPH